jgi:hypothetical protein
MLLNNIPAKFPSRKMTAVDFEKGSAVFEEPGRVTGPGACH